MLKGGLLEAIQVEGVIRRLKEAGTAVVAALQHMLRDTGKVDAGKARHRADGPTVERIRFVMTL